jgi:hypothetical protein
MSAARAAKRGALAVSCPSSWIALGPRARAPHGQSNTKHSGDRKTRAAA